MDNWKQKEQFEANTCELQWQSATTGARHFVPPCGRAGFTPRSNLEAWVARHGSGFPPLSFFTFVMPVSAQQYSADKPLGAAAQSTPAFLKNAGIDQNLGRQLPLSDHFLDSSGTDVTLGAYFQQRPVVMALVYYRCRMLCPQVLSGMARSLRQVAFTPGKEYDVLVASIDPADTPADGAAEKVRFLDSLGNPGAASSVHFLTGSAGIDQRPCFCHRLQLRADAGA